MAGHSIRSSNHFLLSSSINPLNIILVILLQLLMHIHPSLSGRLRRLLNNDPLNLKPHLLLLLFLAWKQKCLRFLDLPLHSQLLPVQKLIDSMQFRLVLMDSDAPLLIDHVVALVALLNLWLERAILHLLLALLLPLRLDLALLGGLPLLVAVVQVNTANRLSEFRRLIGIQLRLESTILHLLKLLEELEFLSFLLIGLSLLKVHLIEDLPLGWLCASRGLRGLRNCRIGAHGVIHEIIGRNGIPC